MPIERSIRPEVDGAPAPASRRGRVVNCRFEAKVGEEPSFSGDRVYVMKQGASVPFLGGAAHGAIKRWDVTVFKLPEEPEVRYIKRVVGMPNEVIRIEGGDLWGRPLDSLDFPQRLRRTLDHQQAMQTIVYDDDHRATALLDDPRWLRWQPASPGGWSEQTAGKFATAKNADDWAELRYHNLVPSPEDWKAIQANARLPRPPAATLITDFSSYNTDVLPQDRLSPRRAARPWFQPHWVGDLTLSLRLTVHEASGGMRLELIEGGASNRCEIDLATGRATLLHDGKALGEPALTEIKRPGSYELSFANVDDRLTLWVDGKLPFGDGLEYESSQRPAVATAADLEPARVGGESCGGRSRRAGPQARRLLHARAGRMRLRRTSTGPLRPIRRRSSSSSPTQSDSRSSSTTPPAITCSGRGAT